MGSWVKERQNHSDLSAGNLSGAVILGDPHFSTMSVSRGREDLPRPWGSPAPVFTQLLGAVLAGKDNKDSYINTNFIIMISTLHHHVQ